MVHFIPDHSHCVRSSLPYHCTAVIAKSSTRLEAAGQVTPPSPSEREGERFTHSHYFILTTKHFNIHIISTPDYFIPKQMIKNYDHNHRNNQLSAIS